MMRSEPARERQFKVDLSERGPERGPVRVIYNPVSGRMTREPEELHALLGDLDPEFRRIVAKFSRYFSLAISSGLAVGLLISVGGLWLFAELAGEVLEGETQRLDTALLTWIHSTSPGWLETPMRLVTVLGYPWAVVPLLILAVGIFYFKGLKSSAVLLLVSVPGAAILGTALKALLLLSQRARHHGG